MEALRTDRCRRDPRGWCARERMAQASAECHTRCGVDLDSGRMQAVLNNETEALADEPEAVLDAVDQHMAR